MTSEEIDLKKLEASQSDYSGRDRIGDQGPRKHGTMLQGRHAFVLQCEHQTLFFNPARNTFHCRICSDVGGSVIDLVCQIRGWDRQQAIDWLAHRVEFHELTRQRYHGKGKKK